MYNEEMGMERKLNKNKNIRCVIWLISELY